MRTLNHYTEEFKKNVVAVIRGGLKANDVARRFNIPNSTIVTWVKISKYKDVQPASEDLLRSLPAPVCAQDYKRCTFVKIQDKPNFIKTDNTIKNPVKISFGKLNLEFSNGISAEELKVVIQAFGEINVF